jgi:hypothetical protein
MHRCRASPTFVVERFVPPENCLQEKIKIGTCRLPFFHSTTSSAELTVKMAFSSTLMATSNEYEPPPAELHLHAHSILFFWCGYYCHQCYHCRRRQIHCPTTLQEIQSINQHHYHHHGVDEYTMSVQKKACFPEFSSVLSLDRD